MYKNNWCSCLDKSILIMEIIILVILKMENFMVVVFWSTQKKRNGPMGNILMENLKMCY